MLLLVDSRVDMCTNRYESINENSSVVRYVLKSYNPFSVCLRSTEATV